MHKIDLSKYNLRTDLIIENNVSNIHNNRYEKDNIIVDDIILRKNNILGKKKGKYITISFNDVTDIDNYNKVLLIFENELKNVIDYLKIKKEATCLIIGLGNEKVISDALGSKVLDNIIITRHMYLLGDVDKKYRNVSVLKRMYR